MAELHTLELTVLGGFPVLVEAYTAPAEPDVGIDYDYMDELVVLTTKGKPADFITSKMTPNDWAILEEDAWAAI